MRTTLLAVLLLMGCAQAPLTINMPATGTERERSITITPKGYGRWCADMLVSAQGDVWVTIQQDGTSDWLIGRAGGSILREAIMGVGLVVGAPAEIFRSLLGLPSPPIPGPSEIHACGNLFTEEVEVTEQTGTETKSWFEKVKDAIFGTAY